MCYTLSASTYWAARQPRSHREKTLDTPGAWVRSSAKRGMKELVCALR